MEEKEKDKKIQDFGQVVLENNKKHGKIHLMTIIGEIEGHDVLPASSKSTKYEHILPQLASISVPFVLSPGKKATFANTQIFRSF